MIGNLLQADLEEITSAWVHWYNNDRLMQDGIETGVRAIAEAASASAGKE